MDEAWKAKTPGEIKPDFAANYAPLNEFIDKLDLLTDIMNGKSVSAKSGKKEGNHQIRNIDDAVVEKLKGILAWFDDWRIQCVDDKEHFLADETWDSLVVMILGTIHLIEKYSVIWTEFELNPSSLQSDICEHHFNNFKREFPDQKAWDAFNATAASADMRTTQALFGFNSKGNCSYFEDKSTKGR